MKNLSYIFLLFPLIGICQNISEEKLDEISAEACKCIYEIPLSTSEEVKNEEISGCINSAIINEQVVRKTMAGLLKGTDSVSKTNVVYENDSIVLDSDKAIIIDIDENFEVIQQTLLERCPAMRKVLETNNDESEVSFSDKEKAKEFYNKAESYYTQKDFESAKKYYRKAVKKDRKFAFAWDMLGLSQRNLGEYKDAIKSYEKSLKIDPTGKVPLQNMGVAYSYLEDYENAITSYNMYINKYPDDPEGFYGVGRMYYLKGDSLNGVDAMMQAYLLYKEANSPYVNDAVNVLSEMYGKMKAENQLEAFNKIAKKYNINFEE